MKKKARPVMQFRKDGSFVRRMDSAWDARRFGDENGRFDETNIARCARGARITYRDYIWIYEDEYSTELLNERIYKVNNKCKSLGKPIVCLDLEGNIVDSFDTIELGAKSVHGDRDILRRYINKKQDCKTYAGLIWMSKEDYMRQIGGER